MLVAGMMVVSAGAWAQTDVTSQYLKNADFSESTAIDNHLCGYSHDRTNNKSPYWGMQDVKDWTTVKVATAKGDDGEEGCGAAGAVFEYGSEWELRGNKKAAPAVSPDGAEGKALGFFAVWGCGGYYAQDVTLPSGAYTLTVPIYNQSGTQANESYTGFFPTEGTAYTVAINPTVGQWSTQTVKFTLEAETAGQIRLGYKSTGNGSGANPMIFIDKVTLTWTDPAEAPKQAWKEAMDAANTVLADPAYQNVTGNELAALEAEADKAEPTTADAYNAAAKALEEAIAAFKAAKPAYDAYVSLQEWVISDLDLPYAAPEKKPAFTEIDKAKDAEEAKTKTAELYLQIRAYYESHAMGEGIDDVPEVMTSAITNPDATDGNNGWTIEGNMNNPRNTESWSDSNNKNDYMYFDGGNWGANAWTTTMKQAVEVPAGRYLLTAKGRAAVNTTLTMSVGENSVELPHVGAAGNIFDRGWNDGSVEFVTEGNAEIVVTATSETIHEWFSIGDFRLVKIGEYTTDGIAEVGAKSLTSGNTFNLDGQRVSDGQKGLLIRDGKKFVVR